MELSLVPSVAASRLPAALAQTPEASPQQTPIEPEETEVEPQYVEAPAAVPVDLRDQNNDPVSDAIRAASSSAPGQPCQLAAWLQLALQHDPEVNAALKEIPRPERSVANAMMFWDGAWVQPPGPSKRGVAMIRAAIIAGVSAAPAACLEQEIAGPELMTLVIGADTTVIVVGSGRWRWADLLSPQFVGRAVAPIV